MFETLSIQAIIFATILKLSSSGDDLVWLPPYAKAGRKVQTAIQYATVLLGVVLLAYLIAYLGARLIPEPKILKVASGALLVLFAVLYLRTDHDWRGVGVMSITFLGSIDELGIFTGMFAAKYIDLYSALAGTFLASVLVVLAVEVFTRIGVIMRVLERIPVWTIIALIGLYGVIDGATG